MFHVVRLRCLRALMFRIVWLRCFKLVGCCPASRGRVFVVNREKDLFAYLVGRHTLCSCSTCYPCYALLAALSGHGMLSFSKGACIYLPALGSARLPAQATPLPSASACSPEQRQQQLRLGAAEPGLDAAPRVLSRRHARARVAQPCYGTSLLCCRAAAPAQQNPPCTLLVAGGSAALGQPSTCTVPCSPASAFSPPLFTCPCGLRAVPPAMPPLGS